MTPWILLLRAVNVGGTGKLAMADLRACLTEAGLGSVKTYIQSGNAVFLAEETDPVALNHHIAAALEARFGASPGLFLYTLTEIEAILAANPFAEANPKVIHLAFLAEAVGPQIPSELEALATPSEEFRLTSHGLFLHAPEGIGRSKLVASFGRLLPVPQTMRNLRTVRQLAAMATDLG